MIEDIAQAREQGARLERACEVVGICLRTYRRWTRDGPPRQNSCHCFL